MKAVLSNTFLLILSKLRDTQSASLTYLKSNKKYLRATFLMEMVRPYLCTNFRQADLNSALLTMSVLTRKILQYKKK